MNEVLWLMVVGEERLFVVVDEVRWVKAGSVPRTTSRKAQQDTGNAATKRMAEGAFQT